MTNADIVKARIALAKLANAELPVPILGMLMLPKTICYILILIAFLGAVTKDEVR